MKKTIIILGLIFGLSGCAFAQEIDPYFYKPIKQTKIKNSDSIIVEFNDSLYKKMIYDCEHHILLLENKILLLEMQLLYLKKTPKHKQ